MNRSISALLIIAGVPEWSNGTGLGPVGLVPAKVRILSSALFHKKFQAPVTQLGLECHPPIMLVEQGGSRRFKSYQARINLNSR